MSPPYAACLRHATAGRTSGNQAVPAGPPRCGSTAGPSRELSADDIVCVGEVLLAASGIGWTPVHGRLTGVRTGEHGTRPTSHSSMPRARGRWRPEGPSREPGGAPEDTASLAGHGNDDTGECGAPLTLGPQHDPYQTTCDQAEGHYPETSHAGPHPLGTRPGDRIAWRGGGRCVGDPLPYESTSEAWQE